MEENKVVQEEPVQMSQEEIIRMLVESLQTKDKDIELLKSELHLTSKELGETKKELELHNMKCSMPQPAPAFYEGEFISRELGWVRHEIRVLRDKLNEYPEDKFLKIKLEQMLHVKNYLESKGESTCY